eukprot:g70043.t1
MLAKVQKVAKHVTNSLGPVMQVPTVASHDTGDRGSLRESPWLLGNDQYWYINMTNLPLSALDWLSRCLLETKQAPQISFQLIQHALPLKHCPHATQVNDYSLHVGQFWNQLRPEDWVDQVLEIVETLAPAYRTADPVVLWLGLKRTNPRLLKTDCHCERRRRSATPAVLAFTSVPGPVQFTKSGYVLAFAVVWPNHQLRVLLRCLAAAAREGRSLRTNLNTGEDKHSQVRLINFVVMHLSKHGVDKHNVNFKTPDIICNPTEFQLELALHLQCHDSNCKLLRLVYTCGGRLSLNRDSIFPASKKDKSARR